MSSLTTSTTTREPFTHTVEVGKVNSAYSISFLLLTVTSQADYTFVPDIGKSCLYSL